MSQSIGCQPVPGDVWGVDNLDPLQLYEWTKDQWRSISSDPMQKPLVITYAQSAERAVLQSLKIFTRLAREKGLEVEYGAREEAVPLLLPLQFDDSSVYLLHRATRFLNLTERLKDLLEQGRPYVILTVAADELPSLPSSVEFTIIRIPNADDAIATARAMEILGSRQNGKHPADFWRMVALLAEVGTAGIKISVDLVARGIGVSLEKILLYLCFPEICDFIRLSPAGPPERRLISFRGSWLASALANNAKGQGYRLLQGLIPLLDSEAELDRYFLIHYAVALKAQGLNTTLLQLRKKCAREMTSCRDKGKERERYTWFVFNNRHLLNFITWLRIPTEQNLRRLFQTSSILNFTGKRLLV